MLPLPGGMQVTVLGREWGYEERLQIGRAAERRAMARERILLKETEMHPIWVAVDDNAAGYDIKSWHPELSHCGNLRRALYRSQSNFRPRNCSYNSKGMGIRREDTPITGSYRFGSTNVGLPRFSRLTNFASTLL